MNVREKNYIIFLLTALMVLFIHSTLNAQVITNPEKEYLRIRNIAFEGKLAEAEVSAKNLVDLYPSYGDAQVLLARILAWQKKYNEAINILDTLISCEPGNSDAIEARNDITGWLESERKIQLKTEEILYDSSGYDLRTSFYFDTFNKPYSRFWKVFGMGAGRYFPGGKIIGGLNIGNIYMGSEPEVRKTEIQLETEAYLKLNPKNYCWLYYAFSPGNYFPKHRAGGEIWHNFSHGWVASTGMNYYYFNRDIFITATSVEKYLGSYWFSGKLNVYFKKHGITTSFYLNSRKYFNDTDYLQLTLGTGTAPDEPYDIETDLTRLKAQICRLTYNNSLTGRLTLRMGIGYSYEEYLESRYRNRFDGNIGFIFLLPGK